MTHIISLLYGNDKRDPTRELSLSGLDASLYIEDGATAPGGGRQTILYSGQSIRFDGQERLKSSRDNIELTINYSIAAENQQHLQVIQRKIQRFLLEAGLGKEQTGDKTKVWLEYRWSVSGLDALPPPVIGQANYYLEVLSAEVEAWPQNVMQSDMVAGYVRGVALKITGRPYWEGLEQLAIDSDGLGHLDQVTLTYTLTSTYSGTDVVVGGWFTHTAADYVLFEYYVDADNYLRFEWDESDSRFEIVRNVSGTPATYNGAVKTPTPGTKYHLAIAQADSVLKSYFNGVQDINQTPDALSDAGTITFGSAISVATSAYTSGLDGIRGWFGNVPTAAQLLALYTSEQVIITAGDSLQYPLYFKTYAGDGAINNNSTSITGSGIIAYYPFEQNYLLSDFSGNDHTLTNVGAAITTGKISSGIEFEKANSDKVYVPYANLGGLNFGASDFSIDFWIKWNSTAGGAFGRTLIDFNDASGTDPIFLFGYNYIANDFYFLIDSGSDSVSVAQAITIGQWYYVALYYDDTAGEIGLSVNGGAFTTTSSVTAPASAASAIFYIGGPYGGPGNSEQHLDGAIDEFGVYDYVIDAAHVASRYNSGSGNTLAVLLANHGVLYGLSGDSAGKVRLEIELPTSNESRGAWLGILPVDSTYTPSDVHYIDFNDTGFAGMSGGAYTAASTTAGSGTATVSIEQAITTPASFKPGNYQILGHVRIVGGSATNATVKPYYRIGETTSPEIYADPTKPVTIATNANFLFQNLGTIYIDWPMDDLIKLTFGLNFTETAAVTLTPAIDFIMLMPSPGVMVECEDATISIAANDALHIDGRRAWVEDASNFNSQLYHFHFTGKELAAWPYKYNYIFLIQGEGNTTYYVNNEATVRVYVTPRWLLPGGLAA